jgi:hypothetical protein
VLFAVAVVGALGTFTRRTPVALAGGFVAFVAARVPVETWLRPHYLPLQHARFLPSEGAPAADSPPPRVNLRYTARPHGSSEAKDIQGAARQAAHALQARSAEPAGVPDLRQPEAPAFRLPDLRHLQGPRSRAAPHLGLAS